MRIATCLGVAPKRSIALKMTAKTRKASSFSMATCRGCFPGPVFDDARLALRLPVLLVIFGLALQQRQRICSDLAVFFGEGYCRLPGCLHRSVLVHGARFVADKLGQPTAPRKLWRPLLPSPSPR